MIEARLKELGITLPSQPAPAANYVPFVKVGNLVFISGQITSLNGELIFVGKVGRDFTVEEGSQAARICALNILSQLKAACEENLDTVIRCIRLGGFVNCKEDFREQSRVINGASDLMVEVFGDNGRHVRAAVGVNALPFGVAVEVEAIFEVKA